MYKLQMILSSGMKDNLPQWQIIFVERKRLKETPRSKERLYPYPPLLEVEHTDPVNI
jgi:hypothetical protein